MAGNKKKRQYHRPPAQRSNTVRPVRLSQCMIVKNEERNIERALSWAKGYAFEQIVVDTGSTDRTVEIAEQMGAKVYHFEWINDFSAAKNYAISLCKGNWIAILDADEWIPENDMPKVIETLQLYTNNADYKGYDFIRMSLVNLNDEGKPFHTMTQSRFFRNNRNIYYTGAIHENLNIDSKDSKIADLTEISILHTGYQQSVYKETGKLNRNVEMIAREVERAPEDMQLKAYLADSLFEMPDEESKKAAIDIYKQVVDSEQSIHHMLGRNAFIKVISSCILDGNLDIAERYAHRAIEKIPDCIDFHSLLNEIEYKTGRYAEAWRSIRMAETLFEKYGATQPNTIIGDPSTLFRALCLSAVKLEDAENAVKYATLALREDRMQPELLGPLLGTLKQYSNAPDIEIIQLLEKLYDFSNPRDKVFLARVANSIELFSLRDMIMARITPEEVAYMQSTE